jgi:hypothetical protein
MRTVARLLALAGLAGFTTSAAAQAISFETDTAGAPPAGFTIATTGKGEAARWVVEKAPQGETGNVVVQRSTTGSSMRFPLLVFDKVRAADVDLSVRFQSISGKEDQAAGLVWRYKNADNYYIVRANALEDNVVLYKVEGGKRIDLPLKGKGRTYGAKAPVPKGKWNTLAVSARGNLFTVTLNGAVLYEVEDATFKEAGLTGLWTKADSVMMFDDFTAVAK